MRTRLTDLAVQKFGPGVYMDDRTPAFGIRVGKNRRAWFIVHGKGRDKTTIGHYPDLSLTDARKEAKRLLSTSPEPKEADITFTDAREKFLEENYKDSTSRWKHIVSLILKRDFKVLAHKRIAGLTDQDIRKELDKLVDRPSAQLHAYRVVRTFLNWCTRPPRRYIRVSPMHGYEAPGKDKKGIRTLTDEELKAVWNASGEGSRVIFRLLILWGTRNAETAAVARKWVIETAMGNHSGAVLTVPGEFTKNGRDHAIPILPMAQDILDARPNAGPYYFQGRYSIQDCLTAGALNRLKRDIQEVSGTSNWQVRDIRRTFRSNMARLRVPREISEVLINHAPPTLDEIYDKYDRLEEKRDALAKYENFLQTLLARA